MSPRGVSVGNTEMLEPWQRHSGEGSSTHTGRRYQGEGVQQCPFPGPDISTAQGHSIEPGDVWLPRPMPYKRFVALMRTLLTDMGSPGPVSGWTFNALRRLMPTGADTLQFSDSVAAWQQPLGTGRIPPRAGLT